MERYARQMVFSHIGVAGQDKLLQAKVAIIGMGALGTVSANNLCRAGIGYIRMADRDFVELVNLQRQILFDEEDVRQHLPKVIAAANHLARVNSEVALAPVIADVNSSNIEQIIAGMDLVLDATDNWEIRLLINEACHARQIPWIYCGAIGGEGMTMNILPGEDQPCLRCFVSGVPTAPEHSCSTFGVLNMITNIIASAQTAEALKILLKSDSVRQELLSVDLWGNHTAKVKINKNPTCPVCVHRQYEYLGKAGGARTTSICGGNALQITPAQPVTVDFADLAAKLAPAGQVTYNQYSLAFSDGAYEIMLFGDGRALIKNAPDENKARSIYTEYLGL